MDDNRRCAKCGHALHWHGDDGCANGECECNGFMLAEIESREVKHER